MATQKRIDLAARRRQVGRLALAGKTQMEISDELNISQSTISRDLKFLESEWIKYAVVDIDTARAIEVAKVDALEIEYWEGWKRSLQTRTEKTVKADLQKQGDKKGTVYEQTITQIDSYGDVRFLQGIERCIDKRRAILGLDVTKDITVNWKSEVIYLLQNGIVEPDRVILDFGEELAKELFRGAGITV